MYWMFIINDLAINNLVLSAEKIAEYLLQNEVWQYTPMTPNAKKITKGDKVLIYLAGRERRYFYATFEIKEPINLPNIKLEQNGKWEDVFNQMFKLNSPICSVEKFKEKIYLDEELRARLSFIVDKKNWGLYFRQGIRTLSEKDYKVIMNCVK